MRELGWYKYMPDFLCEVPSQAALCMSGDLLFCLCICLSMFLPPHSQLCVVMIFLVSVIMYRGIVSTMMYHTGNIVLMTQVRGAWQERGNSQRTYDWL